MSVAPPSIVLGQSAVLSWSSSGVTQCTASGAWSGARSPQGSTNVSPSTTGAFSYVLNCSTSSSGSIAQSATLTVTAMAAPSAGRVGAARWLVRARRTDLVANVAGRRALHIDADLEEPWGVVMVEGLGAVLASRATDTSSAYDGAGRGSPAAAPLRLHRVLGRSAAPGAAAVVANSSEDFLIDAAGRPAPARLLYGGRGGVITAWSPQSESGPLIAYAASEPAAYTGLAISSSSTPGASRLYAADFLNARIDVFDGAFRKQTRTATKFAFTDPALPPGYAPFNVAVIDELVYVACARQPRAGDLAAVAGPGQGLVDVFTLEGDFISRLVMPGSALNAPWALVRAPQAGALRYARVLLVGNTGDGTISAFDAGSGALLGLIADERGAALVIPRLHGLARADDDTDRSQGTLFFTAGADGAASGWYGRLDLLDSSNTAR